MVLCFQANLLNYLEKLSDSKLPITNAQLLIILMTIDIVKSKLCPLMINKLKKQLNVLNYLKLNSPSFKNMMLLLLMKVSSFVILSKFANNQQIKIRQSSQLHLMEHSKENLLVIFQIFFRSLKKLPNYLLFVSTVKKMLHLQKEQFNQMKYNQLEEKKPTFQFVDYALFNQLKKNQGINKRWQIQKMQKMKLGRKTQIQKKFQYENMIDIFLKLFLEKMFCQKYQQNRRIQQMITFEQIQHRKNEQNIHCNFFIIDLYQILSIQFLLYCNKLLTYQKFEMQSLPSQNFKNTANIHINKQKIKDSQQLDQVYKSKFINIICTQRYNINWQQIYGLQKQKHFLKQHLILPIKFPSLFNNKKIARNILVYGPPGTGKTYLMKAFLSLSDINSIYMNLSNLCQLNQETIKDLFQFIKRKKPFALVIDDFQFICMKLQQKVNSKIYKLQNQLYNQINKLQKELQDIFIVAITNTPWNIDQRFINLLPLGIYIEIPTKQARYQILKQNFIKNNNELLQQNYWYIAQMTEGYTVSDILNLIRDAQMQCVRKFMKSKKFRINNQTGKYRIYSDNQMGDIIETDWKNISQDKIELQKLRFEDVELCFKKIKPSINKNQLQLYDFFQNKLVG